MTVIRVRKEWQDIPDELFPGVDGRLAAPWRRHAPPDEAALECMRHMLANAGELGLTPSDIEALQRSLSMVKPPAKAGDAGP